MINYIRKNLLILSFSILIFVFPNLVPASTKSIQSLITKKIEGMTPEEKVGQLFIVGFPQKTMTPDLEAFFRKYKPGSFLLFKRNISSLEQIRELNSTLYKASFKYTRLPPLIAIDQEGGAVSRLPIFPAPPNALAIGKTLSPLLAQEMGYQTGLFLREVGFNMNLAPVLDVVDSSSVSFIGLRSFGSDPAIVQKLGTAYSQGLLKAHVIPTAKHFPGSGSLNQDPHVSVVENNVSLEDMQKKHLLPFRAYSQLGQNIAIMLSHLIYPALDPTREPASFSQKISKDLLRDDLKYKGLVLTDDLQMQGSRQLLRPEAAALKALNAGADIVMLTWSFADQARAFKYVLDAVKSGDLPETSLNEKLRRILYTKAFANIYRRDPKQPSLASGGLLRSESYKKVEDQVLEKNLLANLSMQISGREPANKKNSNLRICLASASSTFLKSFRVHYKKNLYILALNSRSNNRQISSWIDKQKCTALFVAITGPRTAKQIENLQLSDKERTIAINLSNPHLIKSDSYRQTIQLYFNHQDAGEKIAQHIQDILSSPKRSFAMSN